jgi:hypothetical protein
MQDEKPWYYENLMWWLTEIDEIKVKEGDLDEALNFLLCDSKDNLPIYSWLTTLLENNKEGREFFENIAKFRKIVDAFGHIVFMFKMTPEIEKRLEEIGKIAEMQDQGDRRKAWHALIEEGPPWQGWLDELECHTLALDSMTAYLLLNSAIYTLSDRSYGDPFISAVLLRPALETTVRGMVTEHLLRQKFLLDVEKSQGVVTDGKRTYLDTVKWFVQDAQENCRKWGVSTPEAIGKMRYLSRKDGWHGVHIGEISFHDAVRWLSRWNVLTWMPEAKKTLKTTWENLNRDVHTDPSWLIYRRSQVYNPDSFLKELTELVDLLLVGVMCTAKNLNENRFSHAMKQRIRLVRGEGTYLDEFGKIAKDAGLFNTLQFLGEIS